MLDYAEATFGPVEVRRGDVFEQFHYISVIGDEHDRDIAPPSSGVWGVRLYTRLQDARGGPSEAFPHTHYWAAAGRPVYEHLVYADGTSTESGEGDRLGIMFVVRGVDGPGDYPASYDVAYPWRGDWNTP